MGIPGPGAAEWALALLAWGCLAMLVGEFVRALSARFVALWRCLEPIERGVLDFYLGGALLYLVAAVPWDAFVAPVVYAIPIGTTIGLVALAARAARRAGGADRLLAPLASLTRPTYLVVLLSALALFLIELVVAAPVGSGNTFDSSLLTTYTGLLLRNHTIPLSFSPYASTGILYPQGSTVWLGWAQLVYGIPPARTALLVTPLFLGLAPLAGFVFGRRMIGTERAGLATALLLAWLGTGTRGLVYGSNDFVFAFPLVLLLAGQSVVWLRPPLLRVGDAVGFGLLCGYSAAMNPVGAEWLLLALPLAALLAQPRFCHRLGGWLARWGVTVLAALVGVAPSLYVLAHGWSSPSLIPGATAAPPGSPTGISGSAFIGLVDPFLFGSGDIGLSTVPVLRLEIAVLIAIGLAVLLLVRRDSAVGRYLEPYRPFIGGAAVAVVVLLGVVWSASSGVGALVSLAQLTSAGELSYWLFALYGTIAAVPLAIALERFVGWVRRADAIPRSAAPPPASRSVVDRRATAPRAVVPLVVALVIVVPGVVLTPTQVAPTLSSAYHDLGNVTAADFDLLEQAGTLIPSGDRVLVAPGSAGEFLPGYCPDIVLLYPMVPGFTTVNASYELLVRDLPNATFGPADERALESLSVNYIVVTGNNTELWWAFSPAPFLAHPANFHKVFHEADAYLFAVVEELPPPGASAGATSAAAAGIDGPAR